MDGLVIQSVISKWLGKITEWPKHLENIRDRGYNMIHFTPLQEVGESGSPYSIFDQMNFDFALFENGEKLSRDQRLKEIEKMLTELRNEYGILGLTDVVYNHTASNSKWLEEHPESGECLISKYHRSIVDNSLGTGYNAVNSPHLIPAIELDTALCKMSAEMEELGLPSELETAQDLDKIMDHIKNKIIPELKLWEFYVINVEKEKAEFSKAWTEGGKVAVDVNKSGVDSKGLKEGFKEVPQLEVVGGGKLSSLPLGELVKEFSRLCLPKHWEEMGPRYHAKVDIPSAIGFMRDLTEKTCDEKSSDEVTAKFIEILDVLNVNRYREADEDLVAILDNLRGRAKYCRLDEHGPKYGKIDIK
jgi:glycogen debranching enzyme